MNSDDGDGFKQLMRDKAKCERKIIEIEKLYAPINFADAFVYMLNEKEALASFQIRGSSLPINTVLCSKNDSIFDYENDLESINEYTKILDNYPCCKKTIDNKFISEKHSLIIFAQRRVMNALRDGTSISNPFSSIPPTDFRDTQNWLDKRKRVKPQLSEYVPPQPSALKSLMSDIELFMNQKGEYDVLIRAALIHYQFATVRPFESGNGIINRILTPLFLTKNSVLAKPTLNLSHCLNIHRKAYFASLDEVRKSGNYEQWIKFFLDAVTEATKNTIEILQKLFLLRERNILAVQTHCSGTLENARKLFYFMEENPIFGIKDVLNKLSLDFRKTDKTAMKFCEHNILLKPNSLRNRIFVYDDYLKTIFGDEDFSPLKSTKLSHQKQKAFDPYEGINSLFND